MNTTEKGKWGEQLALDFLKDKGYMLIKKNFRSRFGEIDLIMKNNEYIIFVEVKLRKNSNYAQAREFVSHQKQEKMRTTANLWLTGNLSRKINSEKEHQPRFDVIEIYTTGNPPEIIHIENAF